MSSRNMRLLPRATVHSDSEQGQFTIQGLPNLARMRRSAIQGLPNLARMGKSAIQGLPNLARMGRSAIQGLPT